MCHLSFQQDAYSMVLRCSNTIRPYRGFIEQLSKWEEDLVGKKTTNIEDPNYWMTGLKHFLHLGFKKMALSTRYWYTYHFTREKCWFLHHGVKLCLCIHMWFHSCIVKFVKIMYIWILNSVCQRWWFYSNSGWIKTDQFLLPKF